MTAGGLDTHGSEERNDPLYIASTNNRSAEKDKPLKYPTIFNSSDVAVITKVDFAAGCQFR
jgi:Ni2+-binding GTPase involved in maturation of urease and hydrogenase